MRGNVTASGLPRLSRTYLELSAGGKPECETAEQLRPSAEDAPRGMDFLYSANRLNVATSRAMCLAVVVGTAALFGPECKSPKQMRLANAFCRLKEMVT